MLEISQGETIRRGAHVRQILEDELIQEAILGLDKQYQSEFRTAQSDELRRRAQIKAIVLEDLMLELARVVDSGKRAEVERTREDKRISAKL